MATFFRQIARGERSMWTGLKTKQDSPAPAPAPAAPAATTGGGSTQTASEKTQAAATTDGQRTQKAWRPSPKRRTVFTGALGLSEGDKSTISRKVLTGM